MIRVCFIIGTFNIGGAENLVLNIVRKIDKNKFSPAIVVFNDFGKLSAEYHELGVDIIDLNFNRSRLKAFFKMTKFLTQGKFDCVHIHLTGIFIPSITAAKLAGVKKIIIHWHNVYKFLPMSVLNIKSNLLTWVTVKFSSHFADKIVSISKSVKENNCAEFGVDSRKVDIIYNGVDINRIDQINVKSSGDLLLGTIGNVSPQKGLDILIKAIAELRCAHSDIKVEIVGTIKFQGEASEHYKSLQLLTQKLNVEENVIFRGPLTPEETIKRLKSWKIFILASRWEGFGLVLIEAMAAHVPVIASNVNAIPEIISNEVDGLTFTSEDYLELSQKLNHLIINPEIRKSYTKMAYRTVMTKFSIENTVNQLEKIYSSICTK